MNSTTDVKYYLAGGALRDELLGLPIHDLDFSVEAESFDAMRDALVEQGFHIYVETPDKLTIRCKIPEGHPLRVRCKDADFVLCRIEGPYSDGRRPDWVRPGTRLDDQNRRDFTVNSLARDELTGELFDPHGGIDDLNTGGGLLRFVGAPMERILQDGLRVARGFRFTITKGFDVDADTWEALVSEEAAEILGRMAVERVSVELEKMFRHDTIATLNLLGSLPLWTKEALFPARLWLLPTLKERR